MLARKPHPLAIALLAATVAMTVSPLALGAPAESSTHTVASIVCDWLSGWSWLGLQPSTAASQPTQPPLEPESIDGTKSLPLAPDANAVQSSGDEGEAQPQLDPNG